LGLGRLASKKRQKLKRLAIGRLLRLVAVEAVDPELGARCQAGGKLGRIGFCVRQIRGDGGGFDLGRLQIAGYRAAQELDLAPGHLRRVAQAHDDDSLEAELLGRHQIEYLLTLGLEIYGLYGARDMPAAALVDIGCHPLQLLVFWAEYDQNAGFWLSGRSKYDIHGPS